MDYLTLACQLLGGVLAAFLAAALLQGLTFRALGSVVVGIVGGALGGLILADYLSLAPAVLPDGSANAPFAALLQVAGGAAGGAVLMILTGLIEAVFKT